MAIESCGICMGDGRISNAFGGDLKTCPSCHGSGRRADEGGLRDVTKTKPSHYGKPAAAAAKATWPTTAEGMTLAKQIRDSGLVAANDKQRLIQEIMDHEATHGRCTETFLKKLRKHVRVQPAK